MARSSQFASFCCRVLFFLALAQSAFSRLAASFGLQPVFENFPNKRKSVAYVLIEGTGALSCRSKSTMELQHHQWRVHQLVMMEAGRGGIANGIVQQPAAHRRAGVGSPVHKRLAIAANKQSGQRGTVVDGTVRRAHGKIDGAGAHGKIAGAAKRILARQEVQIMWTAIVVVKCVASLNNHVGSLCSQVPLAPVNFGRM